MTAKEFGILADAIKTYFPRDNVLPTENAMRLWYSELKDLPYQVAQTALRKYVATNKFAPTIADIREQAAELNAQEQGEDELNEISAWALVWKAIGSSGEYERAERNFRKLPSIVQRAVHSPKQLQEWAMTQNINVEVVSSNFMRAFRVEQQSERERKKLSPDVLKLMRSLNNPQIEDKPKELSITEQRMVAEQNSSPAPKGLMDILKSKLTN